ncbi:putative phage portal protein [Bacteroides heparinolyticus]|uniref:Putative phage portal protein n=1 Tax=Prevotella heparinolytica TaxID=28113 RepID=A0A449I4I8_9BACE|nr:phage portal protein [Bacteroides heparinolyticus]VFB14383.1 putative phage portal protein [Bacteroides heparinolyticus]
MNIRFWEKKGAEQPKERGYFESVVSSDIQVRNIDVPKVSVTSPEQAMRLATVYRCTSILSGSIASLPLQLKRKRGGYFAVDEESHLNYLLTISPNRRQTAYEMMRNAVIQMVNMGNAYIYPEYRQGEVYSLTLLSPYTVSYDKMLDIYMVNDAVNNIYKTLESEEIIHLRNMSLDGGYTGVSTIRYAATVMSVASSADAKSLDSFQPGSTYSGFISGDNSMVKGFGEVQDEQLKTVSDRVEKELQSGKRIFSVPDAMRFNQLSMSPADIQLMDEKRFGVLDICRFYGVHPDKAFAGQSNNYKASEMSQVQFMTDTLQPLLRQIQNELFVKLIPQSVANKYRMEFDLESFYQTDIMSMATMTEKSIQWGLNTVNEQRMKKGLPPVEGGDVPMISCNVAPITSAKIKGEKDPSAKHERVELNT